MGIPTYTLSINFKIYSTTTYLISQPTRSHFPPTFEFFFFLSKFPTFALFSII
jgi:hypothetical protein